MVGSATIKRNWETFITSKIQVSKYEASSVSVSTHEYDIDLEGRGSSASNLISIHVFLKQVVQECKEIYENSLVGGNPPKAGFVFPKVKCLTASKGSLWRKLT